MRVCFCLMFSCLVVNTTAAQESPDLNDQVIATVNSRKITGRDLQLNFFLKQLSASSTAPSKEVLVEQLIDRELIRQFLAKRKVKADPILLEQQTSMIRRLIEKKKSDLTTALEALGLNEKSLEEMLSLQIAWNMHVTKTLTEKRIHEYFSEHKAQFDGTEVTASQIFKKLSTNTSDEDVAKALSELAELRTQIVSGKISFANAARNHSDSPSAAKGGALGTFEFSGKVARPIAVAAFKMKSGEVGKQFRSRYGLHLLFVEKRVDGDLSLEDARPLLVKELSKVMRAEQVARERKTARIRILP